MTTKLIPLTILGALVGWVGVMALVMIFSDAAPAAVVIWPGQDLLNGVPAGTSVLSVSKVSVTLSNEMGGFGPALYRAGAWLVLPAGLTGCLPMPRP